MKKRNIRNIITGFIISLITVLFVPACGNDILANVKESHKKPTNLSEELIQKINLAFRDLNEVEWVLGQNGDSTIEEDIKNKIKTVVDGKGSDGTNFTDSGLDITNFAAPFAFTPDVTYAAYEDIPYTIQIPAISFAKDNSSGAAFEVDFDLNTPGVQKPKFKLVSEVYRQAAGSGSLGTLTGTAVYDTPATNAAADKFYFPDLLATIVEKVKIYFSSRISGIELSSINFVGSVAPNSTSNSVGTAMVQFILSGSVGSGGPFFGVPSASGTRAVDLIWS